MAGLEGLLSAEGFADFTEILAFPDEKSTIKATFKDRQDNSTMAVFGPDPPFLFGWKSSNFIFY